ncbi:MAG: hypothetical protein P1U39_04945 [Legionellaceae bacterium]|nr:hypothetical protein [Legionellaceae bacterium]
MPKANQGNNQPENTRTQPSSWSFRAVGHYITGFFSSPNPAPTHSNLTTLSRKEKSLAKQLIPEYPQYMKHRADAFNIIYDRFLSTDLITPADRRKLKKDYMNSLVKQYLQIPRTQQHDVLELHERALEAVLIKNLRLKSPVRSLQTTPNIKRSSRHTDIDTSLAHQWKACDKETGSASVNTLLDKVADAHGFIQAIGWSTQNENSLLAILDGWNYYRYADNIAETHFILRSLVAPFYPLFKEYQDIAHREKSTLLKIMRTATPMLIIAGFVVGMTALIPVALPELAFFILAIPLLYLSVAIASFYVKTKDFIYQTYRQLRYHGDLELFPEFQLNSNLTQTFGPEQAQHVRTYYIQELKACYAHENTYHESKRLSEQEMADRAANIERSHVLLLEWFDLHDNQAIPRDKAPYIALQRFEADECALNKKFKTLETQDEAKLKKLARTITQHLKNEQPQATCEQQAPRQRFFPSCLQHRDQIIDLQESETSIKTHINKMTMLQQLETQHEMQYGINL